MRALVLSVAGLCLLSAQSIAGTLTETLSFSGSPAYYGNTVYGPVFDPMLGTLTGVTMTARGSYTPDIYVGGPVSSTDSALNVVLITPGPGGGLTKVNAGGETLSYGSNGFLTGPAETFSESATVTNAAALSQVYTAFESYRSGGLLGLDVFSQPATPGAWGNADDLSNYEGTLTVAFDYVPAVPVPEPASLGLLALGCTVMLLARPRRPAA